MKRRTLSTLFAAIVSLLIGSLNLIAADFKSDHIGLTRFQTTKVEEEDLSNLIDRIAHSSLVHFDDRDDKEFFLNCPANFGFPEGTTVHTILSLMVLAEKSSNPANFAECVEYYTARNYTGVEKMLMDYSPQGTGARSPSYVREIVTVDNISKAFETADSARDYKENAEFALECLRFSRGVSKASDLFDLIIPTPSGLRIDWSFDTIEAGVNVLTDVQDKAIAEQIKTYKPLLFDGHVSKLADGTRVFDDGIHLLSDEGWIGPLIGVQQYPVDSASPAFWDYVDFMLWVEAIYGNPVARATFGKYLTNMGSSGHAAPVLGTNDGGVAISEWNNMWSVDRGHNTGLYVTFGESFYSRCTKISVRLQPENGAEAATDIQVPIPAASATSAGFDIPALGAGVATDDYTIFVTLTYDSLDSDGHKIGEFNSPLLSQPISVRTSGTSAVAKNLKPLTYPESVQCARGGTVWIPLDAQDQDGMVGEIRVIELPSASVVGTGNRVIWKNYFQEVVDGGESVLYHHNGSAGNLDSFTFTAIDDKGAMGVSADVIIHVVDAPSNPPILTNPQVVEVEAGKAVPVKLTGGSTVTGNVTRTVTIPPTSGQITQVITGDDDHLIYTAPATTGTQTMTYRVQDGAGNQKPETVQINVVAPVAHAPVAANVAVSVNPGGSAPFKLKGTDDDGPTLSYQIIRNPSYGTVSGSAPNLTYTHIPANGTTPDTLEYRVTDPTGRTATAFVNFKIANTPPVIGALINRSAAVGQSVSVALTATDTTGQSISYHLAPGSPGTINANQWSHTFSSAGAYTVTILARDRATSGSPVLSESTKSFTVIVGGYASFTDVPPSHPQYITIHDAAKTRGFVGYTEGTQLVFKPDQPITRGEFMTLLLKYSEVPVDPTGTPFPDVPSSHTHFEGIQTFKNRSVIIGYRSGNFGPDDYLERQEMAVIFTGILRWGWGDFPSAPFVDVPVPPPNGLSGYQWDPIYNAINQLKEHGLTNAANLYYRPFESATRVEAVIMMDRYLGQAVAGGIGQDGDLTYFDSGTSITITDCREGVTGPLVIPETINGKPVTSIGSSAFSYCYGLTSVTIPNSVTSIEYTAFTICTGLTEITVDAGNPAYSSADGVLFDKNQTILVRYPGGKAGSYVIPSLVTSIGLGAFHWCTGLTSVTIPSSVTSIARGAFHWCTGLTSVTIPSSVTSIGNYAFHSCTTLIGVIFEGNAPQMDTNGEGNSFFVNTASGFTLYYDSANTGFTSPTWLGYPSVGAYPVAPVVATGNVSFITDVSASLGGTVNPNGFPSVAYFEYGPTTAYGNTAALTLDPANGTTAQNVGASLGGLAAGQTYHYRLVATNPGGTATGDDQTFTTEQDSGDLKYTVANGTVTITGYTGAGGAVVIPESIGGQVVVGIGDSAFQAKTAITSISIPTGVVSIGDDAFLHCDHLASLVLPPSVMSIGSNAFYFCTGLGSVIIPSSVTTIGYGAFFNCTGLTSVTIPASVTSIGAEAFRLCRSLAGISVDAANPNYSSIDGVLFDKSRTTLLQFPGGRSGSYLVPSPVTMIGALAFGNCSDLTSVTLSSSVTSVGSTAFFYCSGLTNVTFSSSLTSIGSSAFAHCSGLTSVTIPSSVANISANAFTYCSNLLRAVFLGNAPWMGVTVFGNTPIGFTVYYDAVNTGFSSPTWIGYPTEAITHGVWGSTLGGNWSEASNWLGQLPASGMDRLADFAALDLTTNANVMVAGTRTIGGMKFGDTSPSHNWTLAAGTGGNMTLAVVSGRPLITVTNQSATMALPLNGTQGMEKIGGGTLVLSAPNTFNGLTVVAEGRLVASSVNALGDVAQGTQVVSGASLDVQGGITLAAEPITLIGSGISGAGALRSVTDNNTIAGAISLLGATRINSEQPGRTLTFSNTGAITGTGFDLTIGGAGDTILNGTIATGAATFTKDGTGTVLLTSSANSALPTNVAVNQGVLELTGWRWTGDSMTGAGVLTINGTGTLRISSPHALGGSNSGFGEKVVVNGGIFTLDAEQYLSTMELSGASVNGTNEIRTPGSSPAYSVKGTSPSTVSVRMSHSYSTPVWTVGNVTGNSDPDLIISGNMVGSYGLTKSGAGTMVVTGGNTYTGATSIAQGALQIGNGGTSGTLAPSSAITVNGALVFKRSDTIIQGTDFGTSISGSGGLTKLGAGTLILNQGNAYGGATLVSEGILQLNDGASLVSGITNNATLAFNIGTSFTQGSHLRGRPITGSGVLVKTGPGMLVLDRSNTYSGSTTISQGILSVGVGGSSGTLSTSSVITNHGRLVFNRSGTVLQGADFSGAPITGTGKLEKRGSGNLSLTAANSYTGDTLVASGTLEVSGNAILDSNKIDINGGKLLLAEGVNESVSTLFFGPMQQFRGTWGSSASSAMYRDDARFAGAGVLVVTDGPVGFATWMAEFDLVPIDLRGAEKDADQDGIPNAVELVLGGNPDGSKDDHAVAPSAAFVYLDPDGDGPATIGSYWRFSHRRSHLSMEAGINTECQFTLAFSDEWANASEKAEVVKDIAQGPTGSDGYDTVNYYLPSSLGVGGRLFCRLRAVVP